MVRYSLVAIFALVSLVVVNTQTSSTKTVQLKDLAPSGYILYAHVDTNKVMDHEIVKKFIGDIGREMDKAKIGILGSEFNRYLSLFRDLTADIALYVDKNTDPVSGKITPKMEVIGVVNSKRPGLLLEVLTLIGFQNDNGFQYRGLDILIHVEEKTALVRLNESQLLVLGGEGFELKGSAFVNSVLDRYLDGPKAGDKTLKNSPAIHAIEAMEADYALGINIDLAGILELIFGNEPVIDQSDPMYMYVMMGQSLYSSVKTALGDIKSVDCGLSMADEKTLGLGIGVNLGEDRGIFGVWEGSEITPEMTGLPESCVGFGDGKAEYAKIVEKLLPILREIEKYGFLNFLGGIDLVDVLRRLSSNIHRQQVYSLDIDGKVNSVYKLSCNDPTEIVELAEEVVGKLQFPLNHSWKDFDGIRSFELELPSLDAREELSNNIMLVPSGKYLYAGNPAGIKEVIESEGRKSVDTRFRKLVKYLPGGVSSFYVGFEKAAKEIFGFNKGLGMADMSNEKQNPLIKFIKIITGIFEGYDVDCVGYYKFRKNRLMFNQLFVFEKKGTK